MFCGNHAQGVASTCNSLKLNHTIFVPNSTPKQKIEKLNISTENFLILRLQAILTRMYERITAISDKNNTVYVIHTMIMM